MFPPKIPFIIYIANNTSPFFLPKSDKLTNNKEEYVHNSKFNLELIMSINGFWNKTWFNEFTIMLLKLNYFILVQRQYCT